MGGPSFLMLEISGCDYCAFILYKVILLKKQKP